MMPLKGGSGAVFWMAMLLLLVGISLGAWCVLAGGLVRTNPGGWSTIRGLAARRACVAAIVLIGLAIVVGTGARLLVR